MKKLSFIIDTVLTFTALSLLIAVTVGYFTRKSVIIILSSVTAAAAITYFIRLISKRRSVPKAVKLKRKDILNKFLFSTPDYAYNFALDAISKRCSPTKYKGLIIGGKTAFKVAITHNKITAAALADAYARAAQAGASKLVIMSAFGADEEANRTAKLLTSPTAEIWNFDEIYEFFAAVGCAPAEELKLQPPKKNLSDLLSGALRRQNAKRYLFGAIMLLLWARFIPYSVAYVAVSAVCISLALACLIKGNTASKRK